MSFFSSFLRVTRYSNMLMNFKIELSAGTLYTRPDFAFGTWDEGIILAQIPIPWLVSYWGSSWWDDHATSQCNGYSSQLHKKHIKITCMIFVHVWTHSFWTLWLHLHSILQSSISNTRKEVCQFKLVSHTSFLYKMASLRYQRTMKSFISKESV